MILFLTSSPSGCPFDPGPAIPILDEHNSFLENLHAVWPSSPPACLMIASNPDDFRGNDQQKYVFNESFRQAGLPFSRVNICDRRNQEQLSELLLDSGFVMLCGGHVPTQNRFFEEIGLRHKMQSYHGIVLGISAGTMNAARLVYAQPEEQGEATDPSYQRWITGLGLTETRVWPHFQRSRHLAVDGQNLEQIGLEDSYRTPFYALPDGSYILGRDGHETIFGEAWLFADGTKTKVCENGESTVLC